MILLKKLYNRFTSIRVKDCGNCPDCGSDDTIPWGDNGCQCRDCGYEW